MNKKLILSTFLALALSACSSNNPTPNPSPVPTPAPTPVVTPTPVSAASLALIQTGATVATGAVLDFGVTQASTRTRLANEIYSSANFLYTATGPNAGLPTVAQFSAGLASYGLGSDAQYAQYTTALASLYATYYAKYVNGSMTGQNISAVINAIAAGAESAAQAYATIPAPTATTTLFRTPKTFRLRPPYGESDPDHVLMTRN